MPITFSCKKHASVLMLEANALTLISMMGHSGAVPGVIKAEHIGQALAGLNAAVAASVSSSSEELGDINETDSDEEVDLDNRALPLRQMLTFAANNDYDVMWE